MNQYTNNELATFYCEGKGDQYMTELLIRNSDIIFRTALRIMKNHPDAEDIMQISYCKIIQNLPKFQRNVGSGSIVGWMVKITTHTCFSKILENKRRLTRERTIISERTPTDNSSNNELKEEIELHLNKLPEIYKTPIILKIMEGFSVKEVSEILKIPEKTIRSQIARGLDKLKASLSGIGVVASLVLITTNIKHIQKEMAPSTFKSSQYIDQTIQSLSSKVSGKILISDNRGVLLKIIPALLISVVAMSGYFLWHQTEKKDVMNESVINKVATDRQIKKWTFENEDDINDFKIVKGKIFLSKSHGVKKSNGMELSKNTILKIDISKFKLPIKLSYTFDFTITPGVSSKGRVLLKGSYNNSANIFNFANLVPVPSITVNAKNRRSTLDTEKSYFVGKWVKAVFYISDKGIDYWQDGKRTNIFIGSSTLNQYLYFLNFNSSIIDDFIIEEVTENSIPSYKKFIDFSLQFPFKKGVSIYSFSKKERMLLATYKNSPVSLKIIDSEIIDWQLGIKKALDSKSNSYRKVKSKKLVPE